MFVWWGQAVVRLRWVVLTAAAVLVVVGVTWGTGLFGAVSGGGFADPDAESTRAQDRITAELGNQDVDVLVLYRSDSYSVDDPQFQEAVTGTLDQLAARPEVTSVVSFYGSQSPALVSADRRATYALVQLDGVDEDAKIAAYERIRPLVDAPGLTTQAGGGVPFLDQANEQIIRDITRAELIALPILLVLLVFIFGGLVAASMPLLVGVLAILGAFVAVRALTLVTEVSVFAINVITLIGLGMAIDYALFVVSRFREELAAGHPTEAALVRTVATAGRTVAVSGLIIGTALVSLLIFPQPFLTGIGFGGMAAVLVAMLASVTALPALLAVLGPRINALAVPLPWRRRRADPAAAVSAAPGERGESAADGAWARIARSVMRRPVRYATVVVVGLLLLATPFARAEFGGFDERVLPAGAESRVVAETIAADFPDGSGVGPIEVLVSGAGPQLAQTLADEIARLPGATGAQIAAVRDASALIRVSYVGEPTGDEAQALVRAIRDLPPPAGAEVLVGGRTAADIDMLDSLGRYLPWMAVLMATATMVLLFLAFGSVVLPVKAVLMNLVSIGASFGVVVWVFQDGHFADWLGFTPTGFIDPTNPILMLAVLFGLATDYEVFLLSRVREEWDRTGDNTASVAAGLQHTGRIITAAALLLIVVVAGFATGGISFIKLIGVGMIVAIVVDATLVRVLLVPATMRLLGRWNWWAPGPLGRVYRRFGLHEAPPRRELVSVGPTGGSSAGGSSAGGAGATG
ncbi:MMPL family transporter [Solwaraspora sp. WMMD406]|uniref:MMPL family transporter n=1 Tax=Solwaraspora sp. WMMD406 TaxID=3016095 RepID=UPI002416CFB9|nr:MMPL family transporter [Solwaraspora sp. WMMD406]MDG4767191.1 MMPL family transporter [Solwaraspora sp. WMMD406]